MAVPGHLCPASPSGLTFECLLSRFQKLLGWARRGQGSFHALPSSRYCTEDPHLSRARPASGFPIYPEIQWKGLIERMTDCFN